MRRYNQLFEQQAKKSPPEDTKFGILSADEWDWLWVQILHWNGTKLVEIFTIFL